MLGAAPVSAFEGRYTAGDKLYSQALTITKSGDRLRGKASVATRGCVGEFDGTGRPNGSELVLRAVLEGRECRLTLRRKSGSTLDVGEDQPDIPRCRLRVQRFLQATGAVTRT